MTKQLLYFVDDYDDSHLKKNVGVFLRFWQSRGYQSHLVTHHQPGKTITQTEFPVWVVPSWRFKSVRLYWPTWRLLQQCVATHCLLMGYVERGHLFLLLLLKYLTGATVILKTDSCLLPIMKQDSPLTWRQKVFIAWPIKQADLVVVESPKAQEFLMQSWQLPPAKIVCLPNGIYPAQMDQVVPGIPPKKKQVIYVGRLVPPKGADLAIKAWQLVQNKYPEWELKIIGRPFDQDYVTSLHTLAAQTIGVSFLGEISKEDLWRELASSVVFFANLSRRGIFKHYSRSDVSKKSDCGHPSRGE